MMSYGPALVSALLTSTIAIGGAAVLTGDSLIPLGVFVVGIITVSGVVWKAAVAANNLTHEIKQDISRMDIIEPIVLDTVKRVERLECNRNEESYR